MKTRPAEGNTGVGGRFYRRGRGVGAPAGAARARRSHFRPGRATPPGRIITRINGDTNVGNDTQPTRSDPQNVQISR